MWGNSSLLRRVNNIEKKLPNANDNMSIVIELHTEQEGGAQIFKIINGEKVLGSEADLKIKPNQKVDFNVTLVHDDEL